MTTDLTAGANDADSEALAIERAVQSAMPQTLIDHIRSGDPVVFCDDDQIRWVRADEIEIAVFMADGSLHFATISDRVPWTVLRDRIAAIPGVTSIRFLTDHVTEAWIDFNYQGYEFTVHTHLGELWVSVSNPDCPETLLFAVTALLEQQGDSSVPGG